MESVDEFLDGIPDGYFFEFPLWLVIDPNKSLGSDIFYILVRIPTTKGRCLLIFPHSADTEEFIRQYGPTGATSYRVTDNSEMIAILEMVRDRGDKYVGFDVVLGGGKGRIISIDDFIEVCRAGIHEQGF